mgnify:CR=1 FL=1
MLLQWLKVQHIDQEVVGSTLDKPKCMSLWQNVGDVYERMVRDICESVR